MLTTALSFSLLIGTALTAVCASDTLIKNERWKPYRLWIVLFGVSMTICSYYVNDKLLSDKIDYLKNVTINTITGGNSYCYFTFTATTVDGSRYGMAVINGGDFPMYDIQMRFYDLIKFPDLKNKSMSELSQGLLNLPRDEYIIDIGNLSPKAISLPRRVELDPTEDVLYYINFGARNGVLHEKFGMKYVNGKWLRAIQVFRKDGSEYKKIYENIDTGYPLTHNGFLH